MTEITIKYSCHRCGIKEQPIRMIARASEEDILKFMERVGIETGKSHSALSPKCTHRTCDIMIPIPKEGGGIGETEEVNPSAKYLSEWRDAINKSRTDG